ncbi:MAG: response regulator [Pseudomonadota bacterium]
MPAARIMIVEDEIVLSMQLEEKLTEMGYKVVTRVTSGEEAISKAQELKPDLILMDIRLSGKLDGVETAGSIKRSRDTPVIYLTAYADDKTLDRAKITEPVGYLVKPFSDSELRATIEVALYRRNREGKDKEVARQFTLTESVLGGAIIATDENGVIQHVNPLAETLTGWKRVDALGKPISQVYVVRDAETGAEPPDLVDSIGQVGVVSPTKRLVLIGRSRTEITVEGCVLPVAGPEDRVSMLMFVFRECTQQLKASRDWFGYAANLYLTAELFSGESDYAQAEQYYRRALAILEDNLGMEHPKVLGLLDDLAAVCRSLGKNEDAGLLEARVSRIRSLKQPRTDGELTL